MSRLIKKASSKWVILNFSRHYKYLTSWFFSPYIAYLYSARSSSYVAVATLVLRQRANRPWNSSNKALIADDDLSANRIGIHGGRRRKAYLARTSATVTSRTRPDTGRDVPRANRALRGITTEKKAAQPGILFEQSRKKHLLHEVATPHGIIVGIFRKILYGLRSVFFTILTWIGVLSLLL